MVDLLSQYYETWACSSALPRTTGSPAAFYLEYLSVLPSGSSRGMQNIAPILALLGGRRKETARERRGISFV